MNESPFQPFRVLASAARTTTTYGPTIRRPRGATGLFLYADITANASALPLGLRVKTGPSASQLSSDAATGTYQSLTASGGSVTKLCALIQNVTQAGGPFVQFAWVPGDAGSITGEVWMQWAGGDR